jgi:hypothetical protein
LIAFLRPGLWSKRLRARRAGFRQTRISGDAFQNGGVAVVYPGDRLVFLHVEQMSGDLVDPDRLLQSLEVNGS